MEEEQQQLAVNTFSVKELRQTAKWAKFLSIVGFVMCGLIVIFGLFFSSIFAGLSSRTGMDEYGSAGAMGSVVTGFITAIYIIVAVIYFFPILYLFQFAARMQMALNSSDEHLLGESFAKLKACLRFIGIVTIVVLCIYALIFIIALITGLALMGR